MYNLQRRDNNLFDWFFPEMPKISKAPTWTQEFTGDYHIHENEKDFVVSIDASGISKEDLRISLVEGKLTIEGKRNFPPETGRKAVDVKYNFVVGDKIDTSAASAKLDQGLLIVVLPKKTPRSVQIPVQ